MSRKQLEDLYAIRKQEEAMRNPHDKIPPMPRENAVDRQKQHLNTAIDRLFLYEKGTYGHRDAKIHLANKIEELIDAKVEAAIREAFGSHMETFRHHVSGIDGQ